MRSKFYIITRFNAPCFPTREDLAVRRFDEGWLRERIRLFKQYCYPSVVNQSFQEFTWLVWCHPDSPDWMREEMEQFDQAFVLYKDSYYPYIDLSVDFLVTTRLDNDDMIHGEYMAAMIKHLPGFQRSGLERQVCSFEKGYRFYDAAQETGRPIDAGALIGCTMFNNPFLTLFADIRNGINGVDHLVYQTSHAKLVERYPTIYNKQLPAWIWVNHDNNTASLKVEPGEEADAAKTLLQFGVTI